jgi:hypothetical protein
MDFIRATNEQREAQFKSFVGEKMPTVFRLLEKLDTCENGKEVIRINADFATDIENELFKHIVEYSLVENKLSQLQKTEAEGK